MAIYSRSFIQNLNNWWIWIRRNKYISLSDSKAFIEYSNTMNDLYENIDNYNPNRNRKILVVFNDMIADITTNKKFQSRIKELFIRCRKQIFHLYLSLNLIFLFQ